MKIGIISCTHDQIPAIKKVVKFFMKQNIDFLIHGGDWVSAFTLVYYKDLKCPIKGVWGNNIGDIRFKRVIKKFKLDLKIYHPFFSIKLGGKTIVVYHEAGDLDNKANKEIKKLKPDVIISGHDHKAKIETKNGVLFINPGTLVSETFPWLKTKPSVALYDTDTNKAKIIRI